VQWEFGLNGNDNIAGIVGILLIVFGYIILISSNGSDVIFVLSIVVFIFGMALFQKYVRKLFGGKSKSRG